VKVIVGSSELWPTPALASKILTIMASTDGSFGVRGSPTGGCSSMVEEMVLRIGNRLERDIIRWQTTESGSSTGFKRDVALVKAADGVFAFFGPELSPEGGTAHVVACALRQGIPVVAFGILDDGSIIELGSDTGELPW
jgi:hypothetical protein